MITNPEIQKDGSLYFIIDHTHNGGRFCECVVELEDEDDPKNESYVVRMNDHIVGKI